MARVSVGLCVPIRVCTPRYNLERLETYRFVSEARPARVSGHLPLHRCLPTRAAESASEAVVECDAAEVGNKPRKMTWPNLRALDVAPDANRYFLSASS